VQGQQVRRKEFMLEVGTKAPEFTLPDQNGEMKSLADWCATRQEDSE
jgi:peroxiredoxin